MRLTPLDIRKQEFRKSMRGYDVDEVDTFLAMVADEMEDLVATAQQAKAEATSLKERLEDYQQMEATMRETLVTVQRAAEEKRATANREAEMILKEAEVRAGKWIEDAHRSIRDVKRELAKLGAMRDSYVTRLKMLIQAQLDMLKLAEMEDETPDETLDMFEERLEALTAQARMRVAEAGEEEGPPDAEPPVEAHEREEEAPEGVSEDAGAVESGGEQDLQAVDADDDGEGEEEGDSGAEEEAEEEEDSGMTEEETPEEPEREGDGWE